MSSTQPAAGGGDAIAHRARSLPSAPSLEYERKEAKALLKRIRAGDADAVRRVEATHPVALRDRSPSELQLADAQHVIAREYGFASWPRLVEYFAEMERHRNGPRSSLSNDDLESLEGLARSVMRRHERGDPIVARELAHYVPRYFARSTAEILATPITEDEARLLLAREQRRASWAELIERSEASREKYKRQTWEGNDTPHGQARRAILDHDLETLAALLDAHPELLSPSAVDREWRSTVTGMAVTAECRSKNENARRVTDFLASRGADVQRELNERLLGFPQDREKRALGILAERIRWYLDRGADPNWMPPNGISVLEHVLARYWNPAAVDEIVARIRPPQTLWVAAGIGDIEMIRSFIAGKGKLTAKGRQHRPDLVAMATFPPSLPRTRDADDLEIMWEAFQVAGWNERWAVMDVLLDAGLPIDHAPVVWPLVMEAVAMQRIALLDYLVRHGADLDREWPGGNGSPRAAARGMIQSMADPWTDELRQLAAICGIGTLEEILAERDAKRPSPPPPEPRTLRAMQLAADDAARQGQTSVSTENMVVGLLRVSNGIFAEFFRGTGVDMAKLRARFGARLLPDSDPLIGQELPADAGATAALGTATAEADARKRESVSPLLLIHGILSQEGEPGARLMFELGTDRARAAEWLEGA